MLYYCLFFFQTEFLKMEKGQESAPPYPGPPYPGPPMNYGPQPGMYPPGPPPAGYQGGAWSLLRQLMLQILLCDSKYGTKY